VAALLNYCKQQTCRYCKCACFATPS